MYDDAAGGALRRWVVPGLGMLLLLLIFPVFLASGLLAPAWAVVLLLIVWAALAVAGALWFRRHPVRVLLLPLVAAAVWLVTMYVGDLVLGWTA